MLEHDIAAIEAKGQLRHGDLGASHKLSKASRAEATRTHAYPNDVAVAVELMQENPGPALAAYETALGGPEPAGAIYTEAAAPYQQTGERDKAIAVIETGYERLTGAPEPHAAPAPRLSARTRPREDSGDLDVSTRSPPLRNR